MIKHKTKKYVDGNVINVTFTNDDSGIVHERTVNVVFTDGEYDKAATLLRIEEVGRGVAHKIASGVIVAQEPEVKIKPAKIEAANE